MKFVRFILLTVGFLPFRGNIIVFAAEGEATPGSEIASLEKKLAAVRDELAAAKTALAISRAETEAAQSRAKALVKPDSEVESLRSQVRVLERDLQSAMAALKRVSADKAAAESALVAANPQSPAPAQDQSPPGPRSRPGVPTATSTDARTVELQAEVTALRGRLTEAEKTAGAKEKELAKLREELAAVPTAPAIPVAVTQELADLRTQAAVARELSERVTRLESENAKLASRAAVADAAQNERSQAAAARDEVERKLAAANVELATLTRDRDELRVQAAKAAQLEERIRQPETANQRPTTEAAESSISNEELARMKAAHADAQGKLNTVLRSFTLLTKERDQLRAQLAELQKKSAVQEQR